MFYRKAVCVHAELFVVFRAPRHPKSIFGLDSYYLVLKHQAVRSTLSPIDCTLLAGLTDFPKYPVVCRCLSLSLSLCHSLSLSLSLSVSIYLSLAIYLSLSLALFLSPSLPSPWLVNHVCVVCEGHVTFGLVQQTSTYNPGCLCTHHHAPFESD